MVVSSRARNKVAIFNSVLPNLIVVDYNYETTSLGKKSFGKIVFLVGYEMTMI